MTQSHFTAGHTPWNAGRKGFQAGGRSVQTQFKKGQMSAGAQHKYRPIGSMRVSADGYLERKTTDNPSLVPARRWIGVHRLVWEAAHGPIPAGQIVRFKPGQRTAIEADITPARLECITRAEHARRNHPRAYSQEVAQLVQLKGAITRQVNRIHKTTQATKEATP